ncbi:MAG: DNA polymerase III subunit delta [Mahellales bacterium]|jgi:DNA polymerase-3 subunit delta
MSINKYRKIFNEIRNDDIVRLYLFYGEEQYIMDQAVKQLKDRLLDDGTKDLNFSILDGSAITCRQLVDAWEMLPFFSDKRLVIVKDYRYLSASAGRKKTGDDKGDDDQDSEEDKQENHEEYQLIIDKIRDIPDTACVVFIVKGNIDKRKKLFKMINEYGRVYAFDLLKGKELLQWIKSAFKKRGFDIDREAAEYLILCCGQGLQDIANEMEKVISYVGTSTSIHREDVDKVIQRSLDINIFKMVDAIGLKNADLALDLYNDLIKDGQHVLRILAMIIRQFRIIFQIKLLMNKGYSEKQTIEKLKLHPYYAYNYVKQSHNFDINTLNEILKACLKVDNAIKRSILDSSIAVEMLIVRCCS